MKIFVNQYKKGSKSAKALKEGLAARMILKKNSKYVHDPINHLVVNWGDSDSVCYGSMLNKPYAVANAANKLITFKRLEQCDIRTVPYLHDLDEAIGFLNSKEDRVVYCRTKVKGCQGDGIVMARSPDELVEAQLYTGGLIDIKRKEFRVHVFKGMVLHVQQKRRRNGYKENPTFSDTIRNTNGGWIFGIKDVEIADETKDLCVRAVEALALDFGAVDVLQTPNGKGWVLEVNTACGLEGTTLTKYVDAIRGVADRPVGAEAEVLRLKNFNLYEFLEE